MKAKIIKNKTYKEWSKKYGNKKDLQIVSASQAKKDNGKILENKKWWLIDGKYYQVPQKKWLIPLLCGLGTVAIAGGVVTPIMCVKGCTPSATYTKLKLTPNFDTSKATIGGVIKASDIKVDGCKTDGTVEKENLVWNTDYTVWMNDTEITNFGTGYKFETTGNNVLKVKSKVSSSIAADSKDFTVKYANATSTDTTNTEISQQLGNDHPNEIKIKGAGTTPTKYVKGVTKVTKGGQELTLTTHYTVTISENNPATITLTDAGLAYLGDIVITPTIDTIITITIPENLTISIGQNRKLTATIVGTAEAPVWSSTDETKATVDSDGYVTAIAETSETVDIVATLPTSGKTATCKVTVQTVALGNYLTLKNEDTVISKLSWTKGTGTKLSYSTDGSNWTDNTKNFDNVEIAPGSSLFLKGNLVTTSTNTSRIYIKDGSVTLSGNLMNLLQDSNGTPATSINKNAFKNLFGDSSTYSTGLKKLDQTNERLLPIKDLTGKNYCYAGMFQSCSLESVPEDLLPATTLADNCYDHMFSGCTSLNNMPKLPATNLPQYCYNAMFYNCKGLKQIPENYTIGGSGGTVQTYACYQMFDGAGLNSNNALHTGLLPATTLSNNCYNSMFQNCENIVSLPENLVLAETLANYCCTSMFNGCKGIISLPNQLMSATTLAQSCYSNMFKGCEGITSIPSTFLPVGKDGVGSLAKSCYASMFYGCTGLTGDDAIPAGLLPATTLAESCYLSMFEGCSNLTKLPENLLPATTLSVSCYSSMFKSCTKLVSISVLPASDLTNSCYYQMFYSCTTLSKVPTNFMPSITSLSGNNCCYEMFRGCSSLKISKGDPLKDTQGILFTCVKDTTSNENAYYYMFQDINENSSFTGTPTWTDPSTFYWYTE